MAIIGAAVSIGLAAYSAYQAHETKQEQKAALRKQEEVYKKDLKEKVKKTIAQQKASFLASGISLTSDTAKYTLDDTVVKSDIESGRISDYYNTQIRQASGNARAAYIQAAGSAVSTGVQAYGQYSGVN